jgi:hypothetical protein
VISPEPFERYLSVLGIKQGEPTLDRRVLTESPPNGATTRTLANRSELAAAIEYHCGIEYEIVLELIADVARESDIYS